MVVRWVWGSTEGWTLFQLWACTVCFWFEVCIQYATISCQRERASCSLVGGSSLHSQHLWEALMPFDLQTSPLTIQSLKYNMNPPSCEYVTFFLHHYVFLIYLFRISGLFSKSSFSNRLTNFQQRARPVDSLLPCCYQTFIQSYVEPVVSHYQYHSFCFLCWEIHHQLHQPPQDAEGQRQRT